MSKQKPITEFFKIITDTNTTHNPNNIACFTDGSCIGNGSANAKGGMAVVWPEHEEFDYSESVFPATNNRCEYLAVIYAIRQADIIDPTNIKTLTIFTDSMLLINSVTKWLPGWKKNNWKKSDGKMVLNLDLLKQLDELTKIRKVSFKHVKAHTGKDDWESIYNNKVDILAQAAARSIVI
jgi:ribonuclease HI